MGINAIGNRLRLALNEEEDRAVDLYDVVNKSKSLIKFGRKDDLSTTELPVDEMSQEEVWSTTNDITHIISSNAADTSSAWVEGHTIDASGDFTFVTQTVTLTGQTAAALTTPIARCSRIYNSGATAWVGQITVYEGGATTAGVPDDADGIHNLVLPGKQQSYKATTTISDVDIMIVTNIYADITSKSASRVDFVFEVRKKDGLFLPKLDFDLSGSGTSSNQLILDPCIVVPSNSDVRIVATSNAANTGVTAHFSGYLAIQE